MYLILEFFFFPLLDSFRRRRIICDILLHSTFVESSFLLSSCFLACLYIYIFFFYILFYLSLRDILFLNKTVKMSHTPPAPSSPMPFKRSVHLNIAPFRINDGLLVLTACVTKAMLTFSNLGVNRDRNQTGFDCFSKCISPVKKKKKKKPTKL